MRSFLIALGAAVLLAPFTAIAAGGMPSATASLKDVDGKEVGSVTFRQTPSGVVWMEATGTGLPAGQHGLHIHETGQCDAAGGFKSAGGHLAGNKTHGVLSEGGPHPGDLPNVTVGQDGALAFEAFVTRVTVEGGGGWFEDIGLFDQDGTAVVLHAGPDDYESQPSGGSGDRIACGVIEKG